MRYVILCVALMFGGNAFGQKKPDCGCTYSANPVGLLGSPCTCDLCQCGEEEFIAAPIKRGVTLNWSFTSNDFDAEAALALATAANRKPIPDGPIKPIVVPTARTIPGNLGDGHTHTCANGHTWNHATHAGHDCPVCGLSQYIQDPVPRQVNLGGSTQFNLGSSGGCANGQCSSGNQFTQQRTGLFGRFRR